MSSQPLTVRPSPLGFGTYRWMATPGHISALQRALELGCTLVDTAPNYAPADVRAALGRVLAGRRREVHVISKCGYTDEGEYSLDQAFVRRRLETEARLVGSGYLDTFLLHNPEHLLSRWPVPRVIATVAEAFEVCMQAVTAGTIHSFGVSSNVLCLPEAELGQPTIEIYTRLAADVGAHGAFRFVQFPHNLVERAALDGGWLARCRELGLTTIGNRPLSVRTPQGPLRIADPPRATAARASAQVLSHLDRHTQVLSWLTSQWQHVASSDALDYVERLALNNLRAVDDPTVHQLVNELLAARRRELRETASRRTRELLETPQPHESLTGNQGEPVALRACRTYLTHLDHVLVGLRAEEDVDQLATLFQPRVTPVTVPQS